MEAEGVTGSQFPPPPEGSHWGSSWPNYYWLLHTVKNMPQLRTFNAVDVEKRQEGAALLEVVNGDCAAYLRMTFAFCWRCSAFRAWCAR